MYRQEDNYIQSPPSFASPVPNPLATTNMTLWTYYDSAPQPYWYSPASLLFEMKAKPAAITWDTSPAFACNSMFTRSYPFSGTVCRTPLATPSDAHRACSILENVMLSCWMHACVPCAVIPCIRPRAMTQNHYVKYHRLPWHRPEHHALRDITHVFAIMGTHTQMHSDAHARTHAQTHIRTHARTQAHTHTYAVPAGVKSSVCVRAGFLVFVR